MTEQSTNWFKNEIIASVQRIPDGETHIKEQGLHSYKTDQIVVINFEDQQTRNPRLRQPVSLVLPGNIRSNTNPTVKYTRGVVAPVPSERSFMGRLNELSGTELWLVATDLGRLTTELAQVRGSKDRHRN